MHHIISNCEPGPTDSADPKEKAQRANSTVTYSKSSVPWILITLCKCQEFFTLWFGRLFVLNDYQQTLAWVSQIERVIFVDPHYCTVHKPAKIKALTNSTYL